MTSFLEFILSYSKAWRRKNYRKGGSEVEEKISLPPPETIINTIVLEDLVEVEVDLQHFISCITNRNLILLSRHCKIEGSFIGMPSKGRSDALYE